MEFLTLPFIKLQYHQRQLKHSTRLSKALNFNGQLAPTISIGWRLWMAHTAK
jgi:hypothetical protein